MVFVSVSETYDLSTKAGKMSLIGVHTPNKEIIQKTYPGLCMNSKFCRIVKQDVVIACASAMPFSADIVGTETGDIAPEDAFNPILYKAVSNESMSNIEARLAGLQFQTSTDGLSGQSVIATNDSVTDLADEFSVYYALLSNRDGFRTANPQAGLSMTNLVPLVFEKYYNYGLNYTTAQPDRIPVIRDNEGTNVLSAQPISSMRGKAHPMPKFNTTYLTGTDSGGPALPNGMGDGYPGNYQAAMPDLMPVYTACIIMPPSRLHTLYYRMVVKTTLEFTEVRPIQEIASFQSLATNYSSIVYQSDYTIQSKVMTATAGMVDAKDAEIQKIMEGA